MKLSDKKSIREITLAMVALGLKNVIVAPGSRNAPLTISFNQHPEIQCTSIRDERSAAFFALGKAIESKEPVGLLCTSGSATLGFAPAISEAFYLGIPLIVITADRPAEWIGQGDGQSINQNNIYENYIQKSYQLYGDAQNENEFWYNSRCISEGFSIATQTNPGPVHFNIPLNEPLYGTTEEETVKPRLFNMPEVDSYLGNKELNELQVVFSSTQKVMILVGQNSPDKELKNYLIKLASFQNVIVLCESTSNIQHADFIENIDRCIMPLQQSEVADYMPDLLITIGGAIISKKIKELLRKYRPAHHWNIHPQLYFMDTYKALTKAIPMPANTFLKQFLEQLNAPKFSGYKKEWSDRAAYAADRQKDFCEQAPYSDFWIFEKIFNKIHAETHLHIANSSPIRYAQLFKCPPLKSVHCNRGTSGIDGCTSTAMGAASCHPEESYVLITGDVAFFYDKNAFWNSNRPENLKVILINNGGGGIFRIIKGPSDSEELEEFFETKHNSSAKKLMEFYGCPYLSSDSKESLVAALDQFFDPSVKGMLLEIFTPNELNSQVLASYFKYLEST